MVYGWLQDATRLLRYSMSAQVTLCGMSIFYSFDLCLLILNSTLNHAIEGSEDEQYIRGLRFDPQTKHLATGTEDKLIRVRINTTTTMHTLLYYADMGP